MVPVDPLFDFGHIFLDLKLISFQRQNKTGTVNMVITCRVIPPNEGMAIGIMMSDPRPVLVRTGSRARIVVAVVIMAGHTLLWPPSTTASLIPAMLSGVFLLKLSLRKVATNTPSSVAIPNRAKKPTQTATLKLIARI